jgi:hypothetical protein
MIAESGNELSLAIVTLVGTIATGIIALVGALITSRTKRLNEIATKVDDVASSFGEHLSWAEDVKNVTLQVKADLKAHTDWEMAQKYAHPWDGTERRNLPPPTPEGDQSLP